MLELAVLGLLKEKPMYGYELKKHLDERLRHTGKFSFGSLYPTLGHLARRNAVEVENVAGTALRRKKVYRITPEGEALFERLVEESGSQAAEDRDAFMVRLAFFRYAKPETRRRLLERRRGYLIDQLDRIKESLKNLKERMDAYSLELMRYGESETEHDIRWLDTMLEAERRAEQKVAERAERRARRRTERKARGMAAIEPTPPVVGPGQVVTP